ncbi:MAG: ABC transporter ATP-binding protein [Candidatus Hydrogenedentes bacterium]|nr:ABC transporter ATP-binding protein [Candidatus Hydrogenedentota bacterium]
MSAIVTNDLCKVYRAIGKSPVKSLDGLDLTIEENEVYGFLGRNGAGKTTTIKILCGLLKPTGGEAFIFGKSVRTPEARRLVGYLPEQPYFYEYLTPRETIDFYGRLQKLSPAERQRQWDKLSELLDLRDIAEQRVKGFSKGMRQRIGFAVALVGDPPLLILDEPMSGLDPVGRRMIRDLIMRCRDEKKTIFFSSHVMGDVEQICDRVSILVKGRLTHRGRIDELLGHHVKAVDVIAEGLDEAGRAAVIALATKHRQLDAQDIFTFADRGEANEGARLIYERGGTLVEFQTIKETLEDFFLRQQEEGALPASALPPAERAI